MQVQLKFYERKGMPLTEEMKAKAPQLPSARHPCDSASTPLEPPKRSTQRSILPRPDVQKAELEAAKGKSIWDRLGGKKAPAGSGGVRQEAFFSF